jgi:hypothetical protein
VSDVTRVLRGSGGGWSPLAVALAAALGFLLGALLVAAVAGGGLERTRTVVERVTVPGPVTRPGPVITTTTLPPVVGERLDVARERLERQQFTVELDGGGLFGVLSENRWVVVAQRPGPGERREVGSRVVLTIERA